MRSGALLLAAGRGARLVADRPKAFLEVAGRPLLEWAAARLAAVPGLEAVVVAVPPGWEGRAAPATKALGGLLTLVEGGETRQASVRRALAVLPSDIDAVLCHDVARPLAGPGLFTRVLEALEDADGAVPVTPVVDTVKRLKGSQVLETVPREDLGLAQTPQAFVRQALEAAHAEALDAGVAATDDAALLERAGYRVVAVEGDPGNVKLTRAEDLPIIEALLRAERGA